MQGFATRISAQQLPTSQRADDPSKLGRCEMGRAQTHGKQSHHIKPKATWRRGREGWGFRRSPRLSKSSLSTKAALKAGRGNKADTGFKVRRLRFKIPDLQAAQSELRRGGGRLALSQVSFPRPLKSEENSMRSGRSFQPTGSVSFGRGREEEGPASRRAVLNSGVAAAVGGASGGGRSRRGGGVLVAGLVVLLLVEAQADVTLQGRWGQPLLGQAALEEGDAGAEVGQSVDPAGDLPSTQQLRETNTHTRGFISTL